MSTLSLISRYRELLHRQDSGAPLDIADILSLEALGASLRARAQTSVDPAITAVLSTGETENCVQLERLGPELAVCGDCPTIEPGASLGLRLDDATHNHSYLFRVVLAWSQNAASEGASNVGLELVGPPVLLRWGRPQRHAPAAVVKLENALRAA